MAGWRRSACQNPSALAARTSPAGRVRLWGSITEARGWMESHLFIDLIIALWRVHPDWQPATDLAWGELMTSDAVLGLLATRVLGDLYPEPDDAVRVEFIRTGREKFPKEVAGFVGGALYRTTPTLPGAVGAEVACAWLRTQGARAGWDPRLTVHCLHVWILGGAAFIPGNKPGDPLTIGRLAADIRELHQKAVQQMAEQKIRISRESPEFLARLNEYEQLWLKAGGGK